MKILLTTPTYPPFNSGLGNAVRQQAKALIERGHEVVVATGGERRATGEDPASGARIEVFAVSGAGWLVHPIRGDVDAYATFLGRGQFDVSVFNAWQTWSTDIPLGMLDQIAGRKYVYSHGLSTNLFFRFQPLRSALRWAAWRPYRWRLGARMQALDGVIFLADQGCDCRFDDLVVANRLGIVHGVVPNAIFGAAAARLGAVPVPRAHRCCLIAVGAYEPMKGHDFVLRAYARSFAKNRLRLDVFGQKFTPYTDDLRRLVDTLQLEPGYVSFHQGVSDEALVARYEQAIAVVSGSHTECQPLILLDAMATGTPFIARARGCIPALQGGNAVETEKDAASAIDRVVTDENLWTRLSKTGASAARTEFHPTVVGEKLGLFLEATRGGGGDNADR